MKIRLVLLLLGFSLFSHAGEIYGNYGYISFKIENKQTWFTITNTYSQPVSCYVAINGFKRTMTLRPNITSKWYKARPGYSYTDVSWRCDPE